MKKDNKIYLHHILQRIERVQSYISGKEMDDFYQSELLQDAVIRNFEVMGEATKNLSKEFRLKHSHVPWKEIAGFRDKLIHDYIKVDKKLVWNTLQKRVPVLKADLLELLEDFK